MDYKQAHDILKNRLRAENDIFTAKQLHCLGPYIYARVRRKASLDGEFTADELEAIALWLRNPEGVINA